MKFNWRLAAFTTVLAFGGLRAANAQTPTYTISDSSVRYASTAYYGDEVAPAVSDCTDGGCESSCESACGDECGPWKLFELNDRCGRPLNVGGWISGGITLPGRNVATTAPIAFVNPSDEMLLNQAWAYLERDADTGGCGLDFGYRVDYVFGADGPDTQAFGDRGWDFGWNTNANYGSAIPQLYGEIAYNNLSVKIGHFFTIIGYEVVPVTGNFFYSHAYTMNYGEPFTHTGALGEYALNDNVTLYSGYTMGWDSGFENFLDAHTFLGGVSISLSDVSSIAYMTNWGQFGDGTAKGLAAGNAGNIYMHSIVYQRSLSDKLDYVFQTDYGTNTGANGPGNEWYGANNYLFYTLNDCWKLGARYEIFRDQAGAGQGGRVGNGVEEYTAGTLGVNYTPNKNLTIRPETRWDWVDRNSGAFGGNNSLFTFGVDAIFTF
ncbi:MAG TPA: porin [Pirellulaceae bacterium]|nr:porin [Pirellulaceae bacterium]